MKNSPTMKEIAERAGVSLTTVSRALQNKPEISEPTTRRIHQIARELGFVPKLVSRAKRTQNSQTVGVVISDNSNPFFGSVIKGIEDALSAAGYGLILSNTDEIYRKERNAIRMLTERQVDGLLITPTQAHGEDIARLIRQEFPLVLVGRRFPTMDTDSVVADDEGGAFSAVEHLLRLGHREIVFLNAPDYISSAHDRHRGYSKALDAYDVALDLSLVRPCTPMMENAYNAVRSLIVEQVRFTAIFAFNDLMAMGAIRALRDASLQIPKDVSVVGFDDIEFVSLIDPPLTTVRVPRFEMGAESAKLLISRFRDGAETHHTVLPTEVVVRQSTARVNRTARV